MKNSYFIKLKTYIDFINAESWEACQINLGFKTTVIVGYFSKFIIVLERVLPFSGAHPSNNLRLIPKLISSPVNISAFGDLRFHSRTNWRGRRITMDLRWLRGHDFKRRIRRGFYERTSHWTAWWEMDSSGHCFD